MNHSRTTTTPLKPKQAAKSRNSPQQVSNAGTLVCDKYLRYLVTDSDEVSINALGNKSLGLQCNLPPEKHTTTGKALLVRRCGQAMAHDYNQSHRNHRITGRKGGTAFCRRTHPQPTHRLCFSTFRLHCGASAFCVFQEVIAFPHVCPRAPGIVVPALQRAPFL